MKIKILLITLFIIISDLSFAETYKWIDEKGVIHFTDNLTQIPEKYRSQVEKIELQEEKAVIEKGVVTPPKKREDIPRDQLGRGEEYWRGLVENWKMKLKISQDKYEALRMKYNELTEQYNL